MPGIGSNTPFAEVGMRKRARVDLTEENDALLDRAAELFDMPRSEVLRRLIQASIDVGPALSRENMKAVGELAAQVRMIGRNLGQLLHAVHARRAVRLEDAADALEAIHRIVLEVDVELTAMTTAYGVKIRRAAGVGDV